jgi:DNA-binding NarL/FixJ family response regulator
MKVGAKGYILKTMASSQLIRAIHEVAQGKIYLPQGLVNGFFEYFQESFKEEEKAQSAADSLLSELTSREEEVLDMLTQGHNYKDVSNLLFISETTVKTHVNNIFQKLQVNDRTQAVLYALNNGFVSKRKQRAKICK